MTKPKRLRPERRNLGKYNFATTIEENFLLLLYKNDIHESSFRNIG